MKISNQHQFQKLFEPGKIGELNIKNRIVMTGMLTYLGNQDGSVNERQIDHYEARAKGGVGLVIVESVIRLHPAGQPPLNAEKVLPGLEQLVEVIHKHGAKAATQLNIPGAMLPAKIMEPVSASNIPNITSYFQPHFDVPREMTVEEIKNAVASFALGAELAKKAGFDAVEIHAAHTFLINSFLSPLFNRRQDSYGGNLENRARFLVEIIIAVKEVVGNNYPVLCKINGKEYPDIEGGITVEQSSALGPILRRAGADAIDVSMSPPSLVETPPGFNLDSAAAIKKRAGIPVIAIGRLTPKLAEKVLRQKKADFIGMARALVADPEVPNKLASGRLDDIVPCQYCNSCLHWEYNCTVNAARRREREYEIKPAEKTKKIVVVGGGPGGMEAARVAALRGHQVTLYEKEDKLGGQLILASVMREEAEDLNKYLSTQIRKLGVKIELGKEVNSALLANIKPDAVVLATGAPTPDLPDIPGINRENVLNSVHIKEMMRGRLRRTDGKKGISWQAVLFYLGGVLIGSSFGLSVMRRLLRFWIPLGKRIIVVGSGLPAFELADFLNEMGRGVSVIDMREGIPSIAEEANKPPMPRMRLFYEDRLIRRGGSLIPAIRCEEITDTGLTIINNRGVRQTIEGDTIVFATDYRPSTELSQALEGTSYEIHLVGDCVEPCGILEAIRDGLRVGRQI